VGSEGSRKQNAGLTNRNRIRGGHVSMKRRIFSKSNTCTEDMDVDVADISGKVDAHCPGRSVSLP
jgi:hypothetical protein